MPILGSIMCLKLYVAQIIDKFIAAAFMKRTLTVSESWILTDIQASLKLKSQDHNCLDENEMCFITEPIIPSILTLRIMDPLTFKDRSYHTRKAVKQLINAGCRSNCLQMTVDSKIEGELLHTLVQSLQITDLKLNWKLSKCKHFHGWFSFLDYSRNNPLGQITSLKMNLTGEFHTKAVIDSAFPNLKCAKFRYAECETMDEMIHWVKEYFVESVTVPVKIILQLKTVMAAYYDQPVEFDAEAQNIYRKIVTSVHNIATSHYTVKEAAVKISLKSTNQKSAATIHLKARGYGKKDLWVAGNELQTNTIRLRVNTVCKYDLQTNTIRLHVNTVFKYDLQTNLQTVERVRHAVNF
jgi:head-tail adaptor